MQRQGCRGASVLSPVPRGLTQATGRSQVGFALWLWKFKSETSLVGILVRLQVEPSTAGQQAEEAAGTCLAAPPVGQLPRVRPADYGLPRGPASAHRDCVRCRPLCCWEEAKASVSQSLAHTAAVVDPLCSAVLSCSLHLRCRVLDHQLCRDRGCSSQRTLTFPFHLCHCQVLFG